MSGIATSEHNPKGCMEETLKRLGQISTGDMPGNSAYVKPYTIAYEMVRILHMAGKSTKIQRASLGLIQYRAMGRADMPLNLIQLDVLKRLGNRPA